MRRYLLRLGHVTALDDGASKTHYNREDPNKGHDHTFFIQLSQDVFAD